MKPVELTFGSDPEFLIVNKETKKPEISFGKIAGTKLHPEPLKKDGYFILYDNVLAEGNIPPAKTKKEFIENIRTLKKLINEYLLPYNCEIASEDVGVYTAQQLTDPRAHEFGCAPFMDVWEDLEVVAPPIFENFRPIGFHIHVGYLNDFSVENEVLNKAIAKAFDMFVMLPSLKIHNDLRRWENYGGFGKYRNKEYGLELRSLGGFFTQDRYLSWIFDQTKFSVTYALNNFVKFLNLNKSSLTEEGLWKEFELSIEDLLPGIKIPFSTLTEKQ